MRRKVFAILVLTSFFLSCQSAPAYSVLTHEQVVDLVWNDEIRPMLVARFPDATDDQIRKAHAYAYGGCLIQDIGYYPFGNKLFSDLMHYVRSGDFVSNMLADSLQTGDINDYAFALGALTHYASDIAGHPAVNASVAESFPKLKAKFGDIVTYADNPVAHIRTEFGFDVAQVAKDRFTSQAYHDFIGFEVSKPLMQSAFRETYGLPIEDVVPDLDLSIGSFRHSVGTFIPELTRVAIVMKKDEILRDDSTMTRQKFIYHLKESQYRREFGNNYQKPGFGARLLAFLLRILPKIGPLRALDVKMPTPRTEDMYMESVNESRERYIQDLDQAESGAIHLENRDFDTGKETKAGEYPLTDETYYNLLDKLAAGHFSQVTPELRANILSFYQNAQAPAFARKHPERWTRTLSNLARLKGLAAMPGADAAASQASRRYSKGHGEAQEICTLVQSLRLAALAWDALGCTRGFWRSASQSADYPRRGDHSQDR